MAKPWIELKEARGRTVKRMNVVYDEEYAAVEVEFEDGHSMNVTSSLRSKFIRSSSTSAPETLESFVATNPGSLWRLD